MVFFFMWSSGFPADLFKIADYISSGSEKYVVNLSRECIPSWKDITIIWKAFIGL
jgi:hypothetical protein